jgi:hypothetical protein
MFFLLLFLARGRAAYKTDRDSCRSGAVDFSNIKRKVHCSTFLSMIRVSDYPEIIKYDNMICIPTYHSREVKKLLVYMNTLDICYWIGGLSCTVTGTKIN